MLNTFIIKHESLKLNKKGTSESDGNFVLKTNYILGCIAVPQEISPLSIHWEWLCEQYGQRYRVGKLYRKIVYVFSMI